MPNAVRAQPGRCPVPRPDRCRVRAPLAPGSRAPLLRNLDRLLTNVTGIPCHVAERPLDCVALGTGLALENLDVLKKSLARPY